MDRRPAPVLVYDGECGFCGRCARLVERGGAGLASRDVIAVVPWQQADLQALGLTQEMAAAAVRWVSEGGEIHSGHRAVAQVFMNAGWPWRLLGRAMILPGFSWLAARGYRLVADYRHRLPGGTPACAGVRASRCA